MKDLFSGPFIIRALHGENAVEVILDKEFGRKHPTFPVSLVKHFHAADKEKFPIRQHIESTVPPMDENTHNKIIQKVLREKRTKVHNKDTRMYLVRYKNMSADHDEWLTEKDIPEASTILRKFRADKRS